MKNKQNSKSKQILSLFGTQLAIWVADRMTKYHNTFIIAHITEIQDEIDVKKLSKSIIKVMKESDTLNMSFQEKENNPVQWISQKKLISPKVINLSNQKYSKKIAYKLIHDDMSCNIDILNNQKPLFNHMLIHISNNCWFWYQRYHHLLVDGFSIFVITKRIADVYKSLMKNQIPDSTPFILFEKIINEYQKYKQSSNYINDKLFWTKKCETLAPLISLSFKRSNKHNTTANVIRKKLSIKLNLIDNIIKNIKIKKLNKIDILSSIIALWLARSSGQKDFTIGFTCMRRIGSEAFYSTGPMVSIFPMEIHYDNQAMFSIFACKIAGEIKQIISHQRCDIELINNLEQNIYNNPLFNIIINFKIFEDEIDFNGIKSKTHHLTAGPVHDMEIMIYINNNQNLIVVEILANGELHSIKDLKLYCSHFMLILKQVVKNVEQICGEFHLLTKNETLRFKIINNTQHILSNKNLSNLLIDQISLTPNNLALIDGTHQLTYIQMSKEVQQLMHLLEAENILKNDIIGVALERSVFLSIALQSIINIGATYLPLDINYPNERMKFILHDSSPKIIITSKQFKLRFIQITPHIKQLHYDNLLHNQQVINKQFHNINTSTSLEDGAYLIYTSGSTGQPKGVIISHQSIVNRLLWMQNEYPLNNNDLVLQKTSCSFDVSVWELFWPLIAGAKLIMAPSDIYNNPKILKKIFIKNNITTIHFVPSMLSIFIEEIKKDNKYLQNCHSLKRVFCSGESLSINLAKKWYNLTNIKLYNLYGPTEATIDVSHHMVIQKKYNTSKTNCSSIPIGRPIWNTQFKILDMNLQPVPPGLHGELYISGIQLAHGYFNKPSITASRFIADPTGNGTRMYRTGDIVRWMNNDVIEYIRRSDDQIKIRGQRIELNEINQTLNSFPNIVQSITKICTRDNTLNQEENKYLVSYIISDKDINVEQIRIELIKKLPSYMVPLIIINLTKFPLNNSGKVDIHSLPKPQIKENNRNPLPGLESILAKIFCKILKCNHVRAQDDFFALGGNSLLAMQLISKLHKFIKTPLSIGNILISPTIEKLAIFIKKNNLSEKKYKNLDLETILPLRLNGEKILFCFHPASGFAWQFSVLPQYLDKNWSLIGIQSPTISGPLNKSKYFEEVCDAHMATIMQQQPKGPYYFIGYSLGGMLAQIISARLERLGEKIFFLGLLDTWPPEIQSWVSKDGKSSYILDVNVLQEINREKQQFLSIKYNKLSQNIRSIFNTIESNYSSSVRLLATAQSLKLNSDVNLFLATKTNQKFKKNIQEAWQPYIKHLNIWPLDCTHIEIMSQAMFKKIGPMINKILTKK